MYWSRKFSIDAANRKACFVLKLKVTPLIMPANNGKAVG